MHSSYGLLHSPQDIDRLRSLESAVHDELAVLFERQNYPLRKEVVRFSFFDALQRLGFVVRHDALERRFVVHGEDKLLLLGEDYLLRAGDVGVVGTLPSLYGSFVRLGDILRTRFPLPAQHLQFEPLLSPGLVLNVFKSSVREYLPALQEELFLPYFRDDSPLSSPVLFRDVCERRRFKEYLVVKDVSSAGLLRRELVCDYLEGLAMLHEYGRVPRERLFSRGALAFPAHCFGSVR